MTSDEQRLADAAEFGRRCAAEFQERVSEGVKHADRMALYFRNRDAAQRHVQATGGTAQDAMRLVYDAGDKPLELPRPRLVKLEG